MCTVDKLLIKGIRSFSPDNEHIIAFYKPLTLIVGHNGAGKTTIIECLKQATTGTLPPTVRSGHSFIHDPQVAGESVVKAQIKLRINNISDAPMVVIRCFQLAQMKSRKEYKALDQTIQTMNMQTGEMEASSYRCVDINKIVPMVMGVSKAILENVIFVHQEDSNWPLADPSELKKRFDDIFAATKYTQTRAISDVKTTWAGRFQMEQHAMKAMKELVKDKGQLVREFWLKMEHLKTIRDQAHLRQEQLQKAKLQGRELREEVEKLEPKIKQCEAELQDAESGLARMTQLDARIQQLQDRRQVQAAYEAELAARAPDISSPTAEIEQRLQQFEDEVADMEAQQQVLARAAQDELSRVQALRSELLEQTKALSRLEADRSNHQRALDELNLFMQQLASTTGMPRPGSEIASPSDDRVQECRRHIDAQLQAAEGELEASRSAHRRQEQEVQAEVNAVDAELGSIEEKVQVLEQQMKGNSARMKDVSQRITSILATQQDVQDALDREAELAKAVEAKSRALKESGLPALMEETAQQLRAVREKESGVKQELSQLNQMAEEAAAVSSKQKDVARMEETLRSRLLAAQPELLDVLGDTSAAGASSSSMPASASAVSSSFSGAAMPAADELHGVVSARQAVVASQLSQHRARLQTLRTDLSMKQGELKAASAQLQDHQQEQQQLEAEIQATLQRHTQPDDQENLQLQERMAAVQEKHDLAQDAAAQLAATVKLSEGWKFADDGEAQAYQDRIDHLLRSAPERERQQKQELALLKQQVDALRSLEPRFARHLELKNALLPKEEEAARQLREQGEALEQQLEGLQQEEAALQSSAQQLAEVMEGTVWPIHSMQQELEAGRAQLRKLRDRLAMMGASGRAQDAARQELEALEKQRADLESKQGHRQQELLRMREQQQQLTMQHHTAKQRLMEVRGQHERKADLEAQMHSLSAETEQLRGRVADSVASRPQLEQKLVRLRCRQEAVLEETRQKERAVEAKVRAARTAKDTLAARMDAALQWSRRGKEEQLSQAEARMRHLQASMEKGEAAHADREQQRSELASSLANTAELKASLKDCLAARKAQEEKEKTDRELQAAQAELHRAGKRQRLTEQTAALKEEMARLCSRRDHLKGMELEVGRRMAEVEAGLAEPQYKDIEARYRQKLVELKTTEMANKDLGRYQKAVERALLSFHTTKMADVNAIIKELWQKTYMNQDIDFIQIKADGDQKSYSYRVVMNSGGTELEMRGRCSAGQKVLASLIIRLALAETFCLKCGILALDEPTTNLDAANSASLADALKALMLSRREQSNFQLVVITHDEAFATMIGTREHTEYLWRVTKDDAGHSHIAREAIDLAA